MSSCGWPGCLRNLAKSAGFGNACFFCLSNDALTSLSETLMPFAFASPSIHSNETSSCITWSGSELYSCLHWGLSWASVTFGWPLAGAGVVLRFCLTQSAKVGGLGAAAPLWPPDLAATVIQWSKSFFEIELPS